MLTFLLIKHKDNNLNINNIKTKYNIVKFSFLIAGIKKNGNSSKPDNSKCICFKWHK